MEYLSNLLIVILILVGFITPNVECMGPKVSKQDPEQMSESLDYDLEELEPDEMIELFRNQWEIDIQRDICPW